MAKSPEPKVANFEKSLETLERIVRQLEAGEKPLDESLALYEQGVSALKHCHELLDHAEQRIRLLVRGASGAPVLIDAELQSESSAEPAPQTEKAAQPSSASTPRRQTPVVPTQKKPSDESSFF